MATSWSSFTPAGARRGHGQGHGGPGVREAVIPRRRDLVVGEGLSLSPLLAGGLAGANEKKRLN